MGGLGCVFYGAWFDSLYLLWIRGYGFEFGLGFDTGCGLVLDLWVWVTRVVCVWVDDSGSVFVVEGAKLHGFVWWTGGGCGFVVVVGFCVIVAALWV